MWRENERMIMMKSGKGSITKREKVTKNGSKLLSDFNTVPTITGSHSISRPAGKYSRKNITEPIEPFFVSTGQNPMEIQINFE